MQKVIPATIGSARSQQAAGRFVINLMSSTTPMALAQPNHPSLKQFTFFITRRRQDRSERFRLHMGYFESQQQAEEILIKVREIFPSAWAGIAPGNIEQKQAAARRAVTAASYELAHVPVAGKAAAPPTEAPVGAPAAAAATPPMSAPAPAPRASTVVARPPEPAAVTGLAAAQPSKPPAPPAAGAPAPPVPASPIAAPKPEQLAAAQSLQSVRAAIDALDDTSATAQLKVLSDTRLTQALNDKDVAQLLEPPVETGKKAVDPTGGKTAAGDARGRRQPRQGESTPESREAKPVASGGYAVQLLWSVAPIDIAQLPFLAIFEAYTLYIAEGTREDRRWYGLRLGFFSDGASAKQVAHYLRSEFASVVVVPISVRERDRARRATKALLPATAADAAEPRKPRSDDYQLLDVEVATGRVPKEVAEEALKPGTTSENAELAEIATAPVKTTAHKAPLTLEETLEILGANDVVLQDKDREMLNNSAVRSLIHASEQRAPEKRSALGKLFDRLGESLGR